MKLLTRLLQHLSLSKLALWSVGLTLLPMLAGMVSAFFAVERLSSVSQYAVHHVAAEAKIGQELMDRLNDLERRARQFSSLRDASTFRDLEHVHGQFSEWLMGLADAAKAENDPMALGLEAVAADEKIAFGTIVSRFPIIKSSTPKAKNSNLRGNQASLSYVQPSETDHFQSVKAKARDMSYGYGTHIEEEARSLVKLSRETKRNLVIGIILLLSFSWIVLLVVVFYLHNPIRQIDFFIRTLGAGNFTQPIQVVGTSDVKFLGERLEWLRTRLNELEMAKQRFVRNVSHEIKTPLATIHEGADLLLDEVVGELNQEQQDIAKILVGNADRMDRMIAELINYSQVSAHRSRQKFTLVNMGLLVRELLEDYRLQLLGRSITVAQSIEPIEIIGDKEQLRTIVDNLLANAVKYSPEGGEIRLSLTREDGHMVLEIEDEGPGIDPDEYEKVFEPFYQGRSSRVLGVKGTGFGLAIVAECVASHYGKVEVLESHEEHAGARLRIKIPLQSSSYRKSTEEENKGKS